MRRLEHEISGHLHDIGAPIELLHLVFEKIAAGKGIAVGFHIAPARIARDRRVAPAEFPSGMLGTQAPAFEPHRKRIRIERIQCRHAVYDNQSMNVELQLHQQFVAKAVDEISGIRSTAHMADLHPGGTTLPSCTSRGSASKLGNSYSTACSASIICPVRKSSVCCCASAIVNILPRPRLGKSNSSCKLSVRSHHGKAPALHVGMRANCWPVLSVPLGNAGAARSIYTGITC